MYVLRAVVGVYLEDIQMFLGVVKLAKDDMAVPTCMYLLLCLPKVFSVIPDGIVVFTCSAFLFSLVNGDNKPVKLEIKQPSYAIQSHPSSGPIFGAGADLFISSECNINKDSYSNLLHSYGNPLEISAHLFTGSYSFQVEDYEVFKPCSSGPFSTSI
jgi:hypothetical protein